MLSYTFLAKRTSTFRSLTGISLQEFNQLFQQFEPLWEQNEQKRLERPNRKRAVGGGHPYRLDLRSQLVMTLVWLRLYLTMEALGVLFGVHKSAISRNTRRVLKILRQLGEDSLWWTEPPTRSQGRTLFEALAEFPDLLSIIDVTEIRIQRPQDAEQSKASYSGKKKTFTRKFGIIVNEHGHIRGATNGYTGHTHDLTLVRQSNVLPLIPKEATVVLDKAFEGIDHDLPEHSIAVPHKTHYKHPLEEAEKWANRDISTQRIVVENSICELKHFKVLADCFRSCWDWLDAAFFAVIALINPRIQRRLAAA